MASSCVLSTNLNSSLLDKKACSRSSQCFLLNPFLCHHEGYSKKHQVIGRSLPKNGNFPQRRSSLKTLSIDPKRLKWDFAIKCTPEPSGLLPFLPPDDSWTKWLWGLVVMVPFLVQRLLTLTKGVEVGAEAVEKVADTVERVAEDVEKMAEDVYQKLPEGGKLKQVVGAVKNVAEETAKDAQVAEGLMDKIEEVDKDFESIITHGSKSTTKEAAKDQD